MNPLPPNSILIGGGLIVVTPAAAAADVAVGNDYREAEAAITSDDSLRALDIMVKSATLADQIEKENQLDTTKIEVVQMGRVEEYHATVTGELLPWIAFCYDQGWTPLYIELADGSLQLMCTCDSDPRPSLADKPEFTLIRVKHEVQELKADEKALYYEGHIKLDGVYRRDRKGASRDLLRATTSVKGEKGRWYLTRRSHVPVNMHDFQELATTLAKQSVIAGAESEVVIEDTNPSLDGSWGW